MQSNIMNYHLKKFKQDYKRIKNKKRKGIYHLMGREEVDFFFFFNTILTLFTPCPIFKTFFFHLRFKLFNKRVKQAKFCNFCVESFRRGNKICRGP
jgi:hypothetical protein